MKHFPPWLLLLLPLLLLSSPLWGQDSRVLLAGAVPLELRGVSPRMIASARLVLERQVALSGDHAVSAPLVDDLAFFLLQRYLQLGNREARVDWKLSGKTGILLVEEGSRQTVGTITFTGVEPEHEESLRSHLVRQTREREGRLARSLPFVESDLEAGLGLVVRRLQADGHLQASVGEPVFTTDPATGRTDIMVPVTQGPLSVFDHVRTDGDPSPLTKGALQKTAALAGQPFSEVRLENLRKDLKGDLQQQGRFEAGVSAAATPAADGGLVPATVTVLPGALFTVSEVQVSDDLGKGAHRIAESIFHAATGQVYDPETIELFHRRSIDTGIFNRLDVVPVALSGNTLALTIQGDEAKPKTLGFFGGYETFFGPIAGIEARHVNFLDSGDSLGLRGELRGTGSKGSLQWTDPAVFSSRQALSLGVNLESFTFKDYSRSTLALQGSLLRQINRRVTAQVFSTFSTNTMDSSVLTPEELGPDQYTTQTVGGRLTMDYRDHPLNPKSGWLAGVSVEGGFDQGDVADVNFVRTDFNAAWYHPLTAQWRVAVGARASGIRSSGGVEELPIDLRIFNGGAGSVRSFAEREMGPSSAKGSTPLGGIASTVVSAELSYEIISNFEVAVFADAGTLSRNTAAFFPMDDLSYAVGLGLRYRLPVGPLRIDYGYNPDRKPGEKAGALHLTFGFAF